MKKTIWLISLLWILIVSWCGKSLDVVEYNDSLVEVVKECLDSSQSLYQDFNAEWSTIESMIQSLQDSIDICDKSNAKASKLWDYEKDSSLKDAVVVLLTTETEYLKKFSSTSRYRNMENLSDEDRNAYDSVVNELSEMQDSLSQQFAVLQETQKEFAEKHDLSLE